VKEFQSTAAAKIAQHTAAPDCLQRPLRSRFRQQMSAGVKRLAAAEVVNEVWLLITGYESKSLR
jgi:hypothetical protein